MEKVSDRKTGHLDTFGNHASAPGETGEEILKFNFKNLRSYLWMF